MSFDKTSRRGQKRTYSSREENSSTTLSSNKKRCYSRGLQTMEMAHDQSLSDKYYLINLLGGPNGFSKSIIEKLAVYLKVNVLENPEDHIANVLQYALMRIEILLSEYKKNKYSFTGAQKDAVTRLCQLVWEYQRCFVNDRYISVAIHRMGKIYFLMEEALNNCIDPDALNKLIEKFIEKNKDKKRILTLTYGLGGLAKTAKQFPAINIKKFNHLLTLFFDQSNITVTHIAQMFYNLGCMAVAYDFPNLDNSLRQKIFEVFIKAGNSKHLTAKDTAHLLYGLSHLAEKNQLLVVDRKTDDAFNALLQDLPRQAELTNQSIAIVFSALGKLAQAKRYPKLTLEAENSLNRILQQLAESSNIKSADIARTVDGLGQMLEQGMHLKLNKETLTSIKSLMKLLIGLRKFTGQHLVNTLHGIALILKAEIGLTVHDNDWETVTILLDKLSHRDDVTLSGIASAIFSLTKFVENEKNYRIPKKIELKINVLFEKFNKKYCAQLKEDQSFNSLQSISNVLYAFAVMQLKDELLCEIFFNLLIQLKLEKYNTQHRELSQLHLAARYALHLLKYAMAPEKKLLQDNIEKLYKKISPLLSPPRTSVQQLDFIGRLNKKIVSADISPGYVKIFQEYPSCGFIIDIVIEVNHPKNPQQRLAIEIDGPHHHRYIKHYTFRDYLLKKLSGWNILHFPLASVKEDLTTHIDNFIENTVIPKIKEIISKYSDSGASQIKSSFFCGAATYLTRT